MLRSLKKKKLGKRNIDFFNIMHVVMKKHGMKNIKTKVMEKTNAIEGQVHQGQ